MRSILVCLIVLFLAPLAKAADDKWEELANGDNAKEIKKGVKIMEAYFLEDAKAAKGGRQGVKASRARDRALQKFIEWLAETKETLGVDLREKTLWVIELLDMARIKTLLQTKGYRGGIKYFKFPDPKGMSRFEYALLAPKKYDPKSQRYPLIISLHGRVIDRNHPAFRGGDFNERSRQVLFDYWLKTPAAEHVWVIAPTGNPGGFKFERESYVDLQQMMHCVIEMITKYRIDWDRIFLELEGPALRTACEQGFLFAGFIVRDRADDRRAPFLPSEQLFMFENLNGMPLLYIADEANWDKVGKPMAEALTKAYAAAGAPQNLIIQKKKRNANGALKGDGEVIKKFVETHRRNPRRKKFKWRFFNSMMKVPTPLELTTANYSYDLDEKSRNATLAQKAGAISFEITEEVGADKKPFTKINIEVTEAEGLVVRLHDGIADLNNPVTLVVNGKVIQDKVMVKRDWRIFWDRILPGRFFMIPFVGIVEATFPHKPQFESPEEKKKEGEGAEDAAAKKEGDKPDKKAAAQGK